MPSIDLRHGWRRLCALLLVAAVGPVAAQDVVFRHGFDGDPLGPRSAGEAQRFLTRATFGPTLAEITRLENMGYDAWLDEQLARPASLHLPFLDARAALGDEVGHHLRQEVWWARAVGAPDQLRQRVAFALSEILVVSQEGVDEPFALAHYYDLLLQGAFGNYRTLLRQVTLHPVMGVYLSMRGNRPENPAQNLKPDENYAREIMQLFSIGLVRLNPDGTVQTSGGVPVPTYGQAQIQGFARVFTGWNFDGCDLDEYDWCYPWAADQQLWWRRPMTSFATYHEGGSKQLLVYPGVALAGGLLPAGGGATADLDAAIDNIFRHPNVPPFVSKLLIQRLVTSNPSPAYVARVAAVFADDGTGERGDLGEVVRAILTDVEARDPAAAPPHAGKLREPLLKVTQLWRAMDARADDGRFREWWPDWYAGQAVLRSPTVFNFFLPSYAPTGEIAGAGLVAPEFQIATDNLITAGANDLSGKIHYLWRGNPDLSPDEVAIDLSRDLPLATNPGALLDRYDLLFLGGRMSAPMRATLLTALQSIDPATAEGRRQRVQDALWLILNSPEYVVEK